MDPPLSPSPAPPPYAVPPVGVEGVIVDGDFEGYRVLVQDDLEVNRGYRIIRWCPETQLLDFAESEAELAADFADFEVEWDARWVR